MLKNYNFVNFNYNNFHYVPGVYNTFLLPKYGAVGEKAGQRLGVTCVAVAVGDHRLANENRALLPRRTHHQIAFRRLLTQRNTRQDFRTQVNGENLQ